MTSNQAHKGALLKQAREAKGITLETVHEVTKIPMDALRAIEEGYNVRILSPFYYKGFVKMYAQYLGLPPESVEEEAKPPLKPLQPAPNVPAAYPPPIKRPVAAEPKPASVTAKDFSKEKTDWKQKLSFWASRRQQQQIVAVIGAVILLFIVVKVLGFIKNAIFPRTPRVAAVEKPKKEERKAVKPKAPEPKKKIVVPPPPPVTRPKEVPSPSPVPAPMPVIAATPVEAPAEGEKSTQVLKFDQSVPKTDGINLTVRAKRNSWLQVRVDNVVVFQSTLNKGAVENWAAKEKIEISGKNINDLEFEMNGKLISSLGKADRQARRLIVTKDGLTIKK